MPDDDTVTTVVRQMTALTSQVAALQGALTALQLAHAQLAEQVAASSPQRSTAAASPPHPEAVSCSHCSALEAKLSEMHDAVTLLVRTASDDVDREGGSSSPSSPGACVATPHEAFRAAVAGMVGDSNPLAEPPSRSLSPQPSSGLRTPQQAFGSPSRLHSSEANAVTNSGSGMLTVSRSGDSYHAANAHNIAVPANPSASMRRSPKTVSLHPSIVIDNGDAYTLPDVATPVMGPMMLSPDASVEDPSIDTPRRFDGTCRPTAAAFLLQPASGPLGPPERSASWSRSVSRLVPQRIMSRSTASMMRRNRPSSEVKVPGSRTAIEVAANMRRRAAAAKARLAQTRSDEAAASRRALSERHPLIVTLDVLFCLASVLVCANAIGQTHSKGRAFYGPTSHNFPFLLATNAAVSAVSLAWIASRFFLAQRDGWEVVDDLARVRARYVRSWFAFDLVFALPLEYAFFGWQWELFAFAQLRHFLRVARIVNLGSSQHPLLASRLWFRFMSFCFLAALLVLGIAAAFWALQAQHTYEESVYWALATVTSVGYGDVVATDGPSRVYSCFAMFAGVALLSTMTAYATSFLSTKNRLEQERETQTQTLHAMLEHYDVPWDVQKEVIGAVPSMLERSNRVAFDRLLERLPGFVAEKVGGYVAAKALLRVPAFASLPREHVLRVARVAEPELRAPDEVVAEEGQRADAAWFVVHGNVRLLTAVLDGDASGSAERSAEANASRAIDLGAVGPGESFGGLDPDDADAVHAATAVCAPACELVALTRGALEELRTETPEAHSAVAALLRPRVVQKDPSMAADVVDARIAIEE